MTPFWIHVGNPPKIVCPFGKIGVLLPPPTTTAFIEGLATFHFFFGFSLGNKTEMVGGYPNPHFGNRQNHFQCFPMKDFLNSRG